MTKSVLAFRGQPGRAHQPDEGQQWGAWFADLGGTVVDMGNQVGAVRTLHSENGGDPASAVLPGYVVITAADPGEAARPAGGSPRLPHGVRGQGGGSVGRS